MTTLRLMGDATHDNVASLPTGLALVAGYVTGTPDVQWTGNPDARTGDWGRFGRQVLVTIDQGSVGAPVYSADVIDVETGAYTPGNLPGRAEKATSPRPTVYCNRSTLPAVLATGWRGDLWLAIPEPEPQLPPDVPGCTVVGVQFKFAGSYDLSVIFDPYWPLNPPPPPDGPQRIVASGVHTVGQIAGREGRTVPELITSTLIDQRAKVGALDAGQRELLDRLAQVHPLPGTVFWT